MKTTYDSNGQSHDHGGVGDGDGNIRGEGEAALQNLTKDRATLSYFKLIKQTFQNQTEKYDSFMEFLVDFKARRIDPAGFIERVKELFKGHRDLISGLNALLPEGCEITLDECGASPPKKAVEYDEALDFTHKIKERFQHDDHVYLSFCDALRMFRNGSEDVTEVYNEVSSLLANHPDLHEEFTRFLPYDFTKPSIQHAAYGQNLAQCFQEQSSTAAINQQLHQDKSQSINSPKLDVGKAMIKEHKKHTKQVEESRNMKVHDQNERKPDISNNMGLECVPDKKKSVKKAEAPMPTADFTYDSIDTLKGREREENYETYMGLSIHELDLRDCECCNVSYRRVPNNYPIPMSSQRSKLGAEVLNDHRVSVTSGSKDHSFKHRTRNRYEQSLFECEDDRFELDLLIEHARLTAKCTEELYNSIVENKINIEGPICLEEYFSGLHLRCIEHLYGDFGLEAVEALRQNPTVALPVMLRRLKLKQKEWRKCRAEFNMFCAGATNSYKSLDYCSFYFRQQDSKNLNPKSLVAEIRDIKEKQQEHEWLQATAAGNKLSPIPHMQFEYSDVEIHEDLHKLVCYACKEIVTSEGLLNKMLRVWTTFLEPMLGVPSQSVDGDCPCYDAQGDHDSVAKSQSGDVSMVEGCDIATPDSLANEVLIQGNNQEEFAEHCQIEREVGEISSSLDGDYEEDNCVDNGDANTQVTPSLELHATSKYQSRNGIGIHNEAGVDDKAEVERTWNAQSASHGSLLERSFLSAKPLTKYISPPVLLEERRESRVIYGNDDFYVLFRLHHILYERILLAKSNLMNSEMKRRIAKDANSVDPYSRFMDALYNFLGGFVDNAKFEDECQAIIGNQSYKLFTLHGLIHKLIKQLQVVANVETNNNLLQLFEYENSRKPERLTHSGYLANARVILPEENIYRLECSYGPSKLFIWLMDRSDEMPMGFNLDPNCADYLYNDFLSVFPDKEGRHDFMLQRNKRKHGASDEFPDLEGVIVINKLDHVITCNSSKIRYRAFTEDVFYRCRKKRKTSSKHNEGRVERFHRFLSNCKGTAPR